MAITKVKGGDGGPVYQSLSHQGLSLRDYFAARALHVLPAFTRVMDLHGDGLLDEESAANMATNCYALADAMLKAREQP
jgi:hypothetical protein